jgi:ectoine hydroxylase-related dioxygenase (phytanoyl-CoA dioxygenase family)
MKVSWYLSAHDAPGHGCTLVVPGSHRWTPAQRADWEAASGYGDEAVPVRRRPAMP